MQCAVSKLFSYTYTGKTAINHNRCLHLTAPEFLGRVRAAQSLHEDFDAVLEEFAIGCPCKNPPLKSKGKQHLTTQTHIKAFQNADGQFYGYTVRQVLERIQAQNVVMVASSVVVAGSEGEHHGMFVPGSEIPAFNDQNDYEEMAGVNDDEEPERQPGDDVDDDLSDIVPASGDD